MLFIILNNKYYWVQDKILDAIALLQSIINEQLSMNNEQCL